MPARHLPRPKPGRPHPPPESPIAAAPAAGNSHTSPSPKPGQQHCRPILRRSPQHRQTPRRRPPRPDRAYLQVKNANPNLFTLKPNEKNPLNFQGLAYTAPYPFRSLLNQKPWPRPRMPRRFRNGGAHAPGATVGCRAIRRDPVLTQPSCCCCLHQKLACLPF